MSDGTQFGRSSSLLVAQSTQALDLSEMHFKFRVSNADVETPNIAEIRVYNVSEATAKQVINEYDSVLLQAGYEGAVGIIFRGTIKQFRRGRERNVDSYLDILAADGDLGYNFGFVNQSLKAGNNGQDRLNTLAKQMNLNVDPNAPASVTGGILPRGKVLFGLARTYMRDLANSNSARWSIQDGAVVMIPVASYLPGKAIQINSATGMIGVPEATDNGIQLRTLLNPLIKIGTAIQINNKGINQTIVREQFFPSYSSGPTLVADVTHDGFYRVLVAEHEGDTRGQEWYTDITCLSLDPSASKTNVLKPPVLPFG
jgi:hypothetical protein